MMNMAPVVLPPDINPDCISPIFAYRLISISIIHSNTFITSSLQKCKVYIVPFTLVITFFFIHIDDMALFPTLWYLLISDNQAKVACVVNIIFFLLTDFIMI